MRKSIFSAAALLVFTTAFSQQPPAIGIAPVVLSENSYVFDTAEQHKIRVVVVAKGLKHPFAVALLPSGDALVSERSGALRLVRNVAGVGDKPSTLEPDAVPGVPAFEPAYRSGGLHDVVLHPQFAQNNLVYFTFNKPGNPAVPDAKPPVRQESLVSLMRAKFVDGPAGAGPAGVGKGAGDKAAGDKAAGKKSSNRKSADSSSTGPRLTNLQELFVGNSGSTSGSRIAFGKDGNVYMTTGAPFGDQAQHLDSIYGKVLRFRDDGKVPTDNPFVGRADARPELFSLGHRDHLGLAVDPVSGAVLNAEHGPNGGDEVNLILPGRNYGWPKVSFGRSYEGPRISESPVAEGVEQPIIVWLPSIGPSGLAFYSGERFPAWKGNLFVGGVRRGEVPRTGGLERVVLNDKLEEIRRETLLADLHQRIRDVRQGPDGLLYVLTDEDDGALLRIEPAT